MVRKLTNAVWLFVLLASFVFVAPGAAQSGPEPEEPTLTPRAYLPLVRTAPGATYQVSGQITDASANPLEGASVMDNSGHTSVSDATGVYTLTAAAGNNILTVAKDDLMFTPSAVDLSLNANMTGIDFAACLQTIGNGGFELSAPSLWWYLPDYGSEPYPVFPATPVNSPLHGGARSLRTGIPSLALNQRSYSDGITPIISVPAGASSASLSLWVYQISSEPATKPEVGRLEDLASPHEPLAADKQYVRILQADGTVIEEIYFARKDVPGWVNLTFDLTRYAGQSIRINVGTYNDGIEGFTAMFVDDVSFQVCSAAPPPPPPPPPLPPPPPPPPLPIGCYNGLGNSSFENNSYWFIPATTYSAGYSTFFWRSGWRSMRTGIYYWSHNRYSYSDFRQTVTIPWGASSATLYFWAYPISSEWYSAKLPAQPSDGVFAIDYDSGDVQYLLVLNQYQAWIDTLMWRRSNAQYWQYFIYDLSAYRGWTINLQWGTYNNGWGGVTSMYVDDATLQICY